MNDMVIAVTGMGRSGLGAARACAKRGAKVTLYDEKLIETPDQIEQVEALQSMGVQVVAGWHGRFDSSDFDVLVTSPGFKRTHPGLQDAVAAGKPIWSEVELAHRISQAPILAVTGTNGKSTTVILTWLLLNACRPAILCGNLSGSGYPELTLTEAADLATPDQWLVAEVSSFQLEWVHEFRPKVAAITNITPDHLDRHPTFEDYFETKLRLVNAQAEGDFVIVNASEPSLPLATLQAAIAQGVNKRLFAKTGTFENAESTYDETKLFLAGYGEVGLSSLPLYGEPNRVNATMAWELARAAAGELFDPESMLKALRGFKGLQNRMERLGTFGGVEIVNNSMCTNPAAVIANARALPKPQILLMGGVTKDLDFQPLREYLSGTEHQVVLFGPKVERGLHDQLGGAWPAFVTLSEAFEFAMQRAMDGDAVILSPGCASAPPYANFRERGDAFRTIVTQWMEKHQG